MHRTTGLISSSATQASDTRFLMTRVGNIGDSAAEPALPELLGRESGRVLGDADVYRFASALSDVRESIQIPCDGVYCPLCHVANVDVGEVRTPCPRCGRGLLAFGWD